MIKERHIRCILFDLGSTLWSTVDKAAWLSLEKTSNLIAVEALLRFTNDKEFSSMESDTLGILLRKAVEKRIRFGARQSPGYEPDFVLATIEALQQLRALGLGVRPVPGQARHEPVGQSEATGAETKYSQYLGMMPQVFTVLGVPPQLGRDFTEADDVPHGPKVALISDKMWRKRFGASREVHLDLAGGERGLVELPNDGSRAEIASGSQAWLTASLADCRVLPVRS